MGRDRSGRQPGRTGRWTSARSRVRAGRRRSSRPSRSALTIWALLDAARRPQWAWALAGRRQVVWMAAVMFGALTVIGGVVVCHVVPGPDPTEVAAAEEGRDPRGLGLQRPPMLGGGGPYRPRAWSSERRTRARGSQYGPSAARATTRPASSWPTASRPGSWRGSARVLPHEQQRVAELEVVDHRALGCPRSGFTTMAPRTRPGLPAGARRPAGRGRPPRSRRSSARRTAPPPRAARPRASISVPWGCPAGSQPSATVAGARIPPK